MKPKLKKIVGIDVSKLTIDVYDGKKNYHFKNNYEGFRDLLNKTSGHYVMEATGSYHVQLASYLFEKERDVSIVNPLSVKRFSQMKFIRAKTDKQDAAMIYEYGQITELELWKAPKEYLIKIKQLFTATDLMLKHRSAYNNQLEAFAQMKVVDKELITVIEEQLTTLSISIKALEAKAEELVLENAKELYQKLKSIPSIGRKSAIMLIAITNEFKNFDNSKQLASYIGICPRVYQSGTSVNGKGKICKMGNSQIRHTLFMCSLTASRYNLGCKQMFERLTLKGKPKKVALVAVMNKLIKQAFAIGTKLDYYNETKLNSEINLN